MPLLKETAHHEASKPCFLSTPCSGVAGRADAAVGPAYRDSREAQARRPQRETLPGLDGPDKNFYYVVVQTPAVI